MWQVLVNFTEKKIIDKITNSPNDAIAEGDNTYSMCVWDLLDQFAVVTTVLK